MLSVNILTGWFNVGTTGIDVEQGWAAAVTTLFSAAW